MSTGYGSGDQGYFISKNNNIVLKPGSMEVVNDIVTQFKQMLDSWSEEKCPIGLHKKVLVVYSKPQSLKFQEAIQMLREIIKLIGPQKNVSITRDEVNNLTSFVLHYSICYYSK